MTSSINRRAILAATGACCYAAMTTSAYAQLRQQAGRTGRPLYTIDALDRMLPEASDPNYRVIMEEAARDPRAFVRARFTFSAEQEASLQAIPDADIAALRNLIRNSMARGLRLRTAPVAAARLHEASDQGGCQKFGNWLTGSDGGVGDLNKPLQDASAELVVLHVSPTARDAILRSARREAH